MRNCKNIYNRVANTGNGKRETIPGTGKWKMRTKPNLHTSPISNSISTYSLLRSNILFSSPRSPLPAPRSPFPVPRFPFPVPRSPFLVFTSLDGLQTRNRIQCEFLLLYFFVIRDVFERILLRNGGNNTDNKI